MRPNLHGVFWTETPTPVSLYPVSTEVVVTWSVMVNDKSYPIDAFPIAKKLTETVDPSALLNRSSSERKQLERAILEGLYRGRIGREF
jgi:hypothetical protein